MSKDVTYAENFSRRLSELATVEGNQTKLAAAAGVEVRRLQAVISKITIPGADLVAKVVKATGCRADWLLNGEGPPFEPAATYPTDHPEAGFKEEAEDYHHRFGEAHDVKGTIGIFEAGDAGMKDVPQGAKMYVDTRPQLQHGNIVAIQHGDLVIARRLVEAGTERLLMPDHRDQYEPISESKARILGLIVDVWNQPNRHSTAAAVHAE